MSAEWTYRLVFTLCIGMLVIGCSRSEDPFPTRIPVDRARQADVIAEFIHTRFDALDRSVAAFHGYAQQVENGESIDLQWFAHGRVAHMEIIRTTATIIWDFYDSPEGAYLSEQDQEFIERTLANREKQRKLMWTLMPAGGFEYSAEISKELNLPLWFTAGHAVREFLRRIPDELLEACAEAIRASMLAEGQQELWHALARGDAAAVQAYQNSGQSPTLIYFTGYIPAATLKSAQLDAQDDALVKIAERPLGLALSQAFGAQMYGFILVSLERVGYNAYMGERELDRLHQRAMAAVKAVETRR